jgi:hypothetical protein
MSDSRDSFHAADRSLPISMFEQSVIIRLVPEFILKIFLRIIFFLVFANLFLQVFGLFTIRFKGKGMLLGLFNLDYERNIPSLFSFTLLLFASVLLAVIAIIKRQEVEISHHGYWFFLSAIFFYLAIDELIEIHEHLAIFLRGKFNLTGIFWFAWVIPFGIGLVLIIIFCYKFIFNAIPRKTRKLFLKAGVFYVFGALIIEMLGGWFFTNFGSANYGWVLLTTLEEGLEMYGIVLFIYALLDYMRDIFKSLSFEFPAGV